MAPFIAKQGSAQAIPKAMLHFHSLDLENILHFIAVEMAASFYDFIVALEWYPYVETLKTKCIS